MVFRDRFRSGPALSADGGQRLDRARRNARPKVLGAFWRESQRWPVAGCLTTHSSKQGERCFAGYRVLS